MAEKVSQGQKQQQNPLMTSARVINRVLDLANREGTGGFFRPKPDIRQPLGTDFVMVKNLTGDYRERGECVQLGEFLLEDDDRYSLWYEGNTPEEPLWKCAILNKPAATDAIVRAHCQGVCVAKVDVRSLIDTHAYPVDGSYVLESGFDGMFELLETPEGTGEQLLAVRFMGSGSSSLIVGVPPLTEDDGIVVPIADGWFSGSVASYNSITDLFAIVPDSEVWVRSLNHHPCLYVPANWMGFAKFLGVREVGEGEDAERLAFVIETPPEALEWGRLLGILGYRQSASVRLDPPAFNIIVEAFDLLLNPGQTLDTGTRVCLGVRQDVGGATLRAVVSAACEPGA
jgi:hypothetical protein